MKKFINLIPLLAVLFCNGQADLEKKDLNNLIAIAQLYSQNSNARGEDFVNNINALRTPALEHMADLLIATGKGDSTILQSRFLQRPGHDELMMWYVVHKINANRQEKNKKSKADEEVAAEALSRSIDERWLLDNYYHYLKNGIATLFNDADLGNYNFAMDHYGLNDETEKAILFLNVIDALAIRFRVLQVVKNNQKLLEFAARMPSFNGRPYYYYTGFDYPDFDYPSSENKETYNEMWIARFYSILLAHLDAVAELEPGTKAREIYMNSILHEPAYFKFSGMKKDLQKLYNKTK